MYKKMLVLLDGSRLAEVVCSYARELSGRLDLELELLNVCPPEKADELAMHEAYIERVARELTDGGTEITGQAVTQEGLTVKGTVVIGYPAEEILKYAEQNDIDLIMLSTHGYSGIRLWNLGSVANKVVHAAKVPVWVVPSQLREEVIRDRVPRRLMVILLDGSKSAEAVIPHALNIARQRGAETEVVLLHVMPLNRYYFSKSDIIKDQEEQRAIQKYLEGIVREIEKAGIPARYDVLSGDPAETVIGFVKNNPTQLIAMATQGRTGFNLMVFGSVTENVLQLVKKTPIFLVKAPG